MKVTVQEVVVDCADPAGLAAFWARLLEARWGLVDDGWAVVDAEPLMVCFQRVPEPRPGPKNRLHLDLEVDDLDDAVRHGQDLGARVLHPARFEGDSGFVVMADPEDNEFCFVTDPSGSFMATVRDSLDRPS